MFLLHFCVLRNNASASFVVALCMIPDRMPANRPSIDLIGFVQVTSLSLFLPLSCCLSSHLPFPPVGASADARYPIYLSALDASDAGCSRATT